MAKIKQYFFIILSTIFVVISVECNKFVEFKKNLFSIRNFDVLNGIHETLFGNWTQDQQCLTELNAIKNGLKNSEEWAFKSKSMLSLSLFRCQSNRSIQH